MFIYIYIKFDLHYEFFFTGDRDLSHVIGHIVLGTIVFVFVAATLVNFILR